MDPYEGLDHFTMLISAPRRTGKTFFTTMAIPYDFIHSFDYIEIFSPTAVFNKAYNQFELNCNREVMNEVGSLREALVLSPEERAMIKSFAHAEDLDDINSYLDEPSDYFELLPEDCRMMISVHEDLNDVQMLLNRQSELFRECENDPLLNPPRILIILDDCINDGIMREMTGLVTKVATIGRHFKISMIVITQQFKKVQKAFRLNSDIILLFTPFAISEVEEFLEQFFPRQLRKVAVKIFLRIFQVPRFCVLIRNHEPRWTKRLMFTWTQVLTRHRLAFPINYGDIGLDEFEHR